MASLNLNIVTFNCGRALIQHDVFASDLFDALPDSQLPDILVLCLQEIAPIAQSFLGGSFLTPFFDAFRNAVKLASKDTIYVNTKTCNLGMTGIMIFVRQDQVSRVSWMQVAGVGVGVQEMGNKGAVGVRMGFSIEEGDPPLVMTFVASHLAAMEDAVERRNKDYQDIIKGLAFVPELSQKSMASDVGSEDVPLLQGFQDAELESASTGMYSARSHLFFAGDLNYRTSVSKPTADDVKNFPQPTADRSSPLHFSHLLKKDQLTQQLKMGKTLHGMTEAPISFPPTYKYSANAAELAHTDKKLDWSARRWPSWCDRIFYLDLPSWMQQGGTSLKVNVQNYTALQISPTSDHRPVALSLSIPLVPIQRPDEQVSDLRLNPPFALDPSWKSRRDLARKKEMMVGILAYLSLTWEGNALLLAAAIGGFGAWLIFTSLLAF